MEPTRAEDQFGLQRPKMPVSAKRPSVTGAVRVNTHDHCYYLFARWRHRVNALFKLGYTRAITFVSSSLRMAQFDT